MFSSAFSRIGDAHPASRFSSSNMVALIAASIRGPDPDSGYFIPSTPSWNCDIPQTRMGSRPSTWTEVPWPRRVLGVEGDDTVRFNMKTPRTPKAYVTMPYRTYATRNNGPKTNSPVGPVLAPRVMYARAAIPSNVAISPRSRRLPLVTRTWTISRVISLSRSFSRNSTSRPSRTTTPSLETVGPLRRNFAVNATPNVLPVFVSKPP